MAGSRLASTIVASFKVVATAVGTLGLGTKSTKVYTQGVSIDTQPV